MGDSQDRQERSTRAFVRTRHQDGGRFSGGTLEGKRPEGVFYSVVEAALGYTKRVLIVRKACPNQVQVRCQLHRVQDGKREQLDETYDEV